MQKKVGNRIGYTELLAVGTHSHSQRSLVTLTSTSTQQIVRLVWHGGGIHTPRRCGIWIR